MMLGFGGSAESIILREVGWWYSNDMRHVQEQNLSSLVAITTSVTVHVYIAQLRRDLVNILGLPVPSRDG